MRWRQLHLENSENTDIKQSFDRLFPFGRFLLKRLFELYALLKPIAYRKLSNTHHTTALLRSNLDFQSNQSNLKCQIPYTVPLCCFGLCWLSIEPPKNAPYVEAL